MRDSAPSLPTQPLGRRRLLAGWLLPALCAGPAGWTQAWAALGNGKGAGSANGLAPGAAPVTWTGAGGGRGVLGGAPAPAKPRPVLPDAVRARLASSGLPLDSFGLFAAPVEGGAPLLSWQSDQPFVLASTAKVVTAMAALDLLGPRYRWRTRAYLMGPLVNGRLLGDLLIVGGGDVQLTCDDLRQWFGQMRAQGLREVQGDIRIDRRAFLLSDGDYLTTPIPAPDRPHHQRPDAFMLEGGVVRVAVQPSRGGQALVSMTPPLSDVRLVNGVAMNGGCNASAQWRPQRGRPELQVSGSWSPACGSREIAFAPLSADELTLRAVGALWRQAGGGLRGDVRDHQVAASAPRFPVGSDQQPLPVWLTHGSPPLTTLVHAMNKSSQNVAARHLMLSLSPGFPSKPATLAGAQARLRSWLLKQGLAQGDVVLDNGSGLSRAERGKPSAMVQLLRRAWRSPNAQAFIESLPVAGVDGTLAHRLQQQAVLGQAHLKTGTLLDTRGLAGYVRARSGRWYAVTALANHPAAALATPALDGVIDWLARQG